MDAQTLDAHYRRFPQTDAEWLEHYPGIDSFRDASMAYLMPEDPAVQEHIAWLDCMDGLRAFMANEQARRDTWWRRVVRIS
jgi:hypothetical protein